MTSHDPVEVEGAMTALRSLLPRGSTITVNVLSDQGTAMHLRVHAAGHAISRDVALATGYHFDADRDSVWTWQFNGDRRSYITRILADTLYGDPTTLRWRTDDLSG
jgi:hypothetical protein